MASHLKDEALKLAAVSADAALFGRSAFNRYYYAAYLTVKADLNPIFPAMPTSHASVPEFLRGTVERELRARKKQARRASDHETVGTVQHAQQATIALADILALGYSVRVNADYHPEIPILFADRGFRLNQVTISEAVSWPSKARFFTSKIVTAMRQTHA